MVLPVFASAAAGMLTSCVLEMTQDGRDVTVRHVSGRGTTLVERAVEALHSFGRQQKMQGTT